MQWYLMIGGQRRGPLRRESVETLLDKGAVDGSTPVYREGYADWQPLAQAAEFAARFPPAPAPQPAPAAGPAWRQQVAERGEAVPMAPAVPKPAAAGSPGTPHGERRQAEPQRGYLRRHWRGELPLARSYWVNGVLLSLALGLVTGVMVSSLAWRSLTSDDPRALLVAIVLLPLLALLPSPWQLVGILRSARRARREGRGGLWPALAIAVTWLGVISGVVQLGMTALTLPDTLRAALAPAASPYTVAVSDTGDRLRVSGPLAYGITGAVRRALASHPGIETIELDSEDGRGLSALTLARLIAGGNYTTLVTGQCTGACAIAFLGGRRRVLDADGSLGFTALPSDIDIGHGFDLDRTLMHATLRFLGEHGLDAEFAQAALSVDGEHLWQPKPLELLQAHAISAVRIDGRLVGTAQYAEASAGRLLDGLARTPPFQAMAQHYPEQWQRSRAVLRAVLTEEGKADTETPAFRSAQQREMRNIAIALLPTTSDEAAVRYGRAYVHELQWLRRNHPEVCLGAIYARERDVADVESYADAATTADYDAALQQLIEDARLHPSSPPRSGEVAAERASLLALIESRYPAPFLAAIRTRDGARAAEPLSVCVYEITVIESALKLAPDRAGRVLRSLVGGATL